MSEATEDATPEPAWLSIHDGEGEKLPAHMPVQLKYEDGYVCDLEAREVNWQDHRPIQYRTMVAI
jgi:hypothetical protein